MKFNTKTLSSAVRLALSVSTIMGAGLSCSAFAQEAGTDQSSPSGQKATTLQAVVVTGSHIRRVDVETSNPVIQLNHDALAATGAQTIGDVLQTLPALTGGGLGTTNNSAGPGDGSSTVSLRGLGSKRTLLLVDGRRVLSSDVNVIPLNMIDHVEVLTSGASATYGSDAIGGVVNFITRQNYQGAQLTSNYGQSSHADARTRGATLTFGETGDKGSIIAGIGYNKTDGVPGSRRWFSRDALSISGSQNTPVRPFLGGSSSSSYGHIQIPNSGPVRTAFADCTSGFLARNPSASGMNPISDYHCYQNTGANSDKYSDYTRYSLNVTPQERTNAFVLGSRNINDNMSVYFNGYVTRTTATRQLAPSYYADSNGADISPDNYYNPFGVQLGAGGYSFAARFPPTAARQINTSRSDYQTSTGLKGVFTLFSQDWTWDLGMDYGHFESVVTSLGFASSSKLYAGPSFMDSNGVVQCGAPGNVIAGCDATFNPFNMQSAATAAAIANATQAPNTINYSQEKTYRFNAGGGLFDMPAGTVALAVGGNYRQDSSSTRVDPIVELNPLTGTCQAGGSCTSSVSGGFNVKELYGELFVPILADLPGIKALNVTIADRYSRFSSFGSTNNKSFAVEYRPTSEVLLRGTMTQVFRAPDIGEVFAPVTAGGPFLTADPCDHYTGNPVNPACINVPTDGSFRNAAVAAGTQVTTSKSGSESAGFPIKPEAGKTFDLGVVYSPSWAEGLSGSVDVWHIYLNDIISNVGLASVLNLCSAGQTTFCPLIHRYPSGPQQGQLTHFTAEPTANLGSASVGGVDGNVAYRLPTTSWGNFTFMANATYLKYYNQQTAPGTDANVTYHDAGHFLPTGSASASACPTVTLTCLFPRIRASGNARWRMGDWTASWKVNYVGQFRLGSQSPIQDVHPAGRKLNGVVFDYGSRIYHDVAVGYKFEPLSTRVDVGVNNLFDKQPPMFYENNSASSNTSPADFDIIGRYYWVRLTVDI